jgi:hypothetical protein
MPTMNTISVDLDVNALQDLPEDQQLALEDLGGAELQKCSETCYFTCVWTCYPWTLF